VKAVAQLKAGCTPRAHLPRRPTTFATGNVVPKTWLTPPIAISPRGAEEERAGVNEMHTHRAIFDVNFAGAGPRWRLVRCSSSLSSITALALEERTGFGSEKEHVCGRPHVLRRCGRTLRPDNRCDPGLASVRGRDWPAPETRAFKSCPSNSTTRNLGC
jgi:hypothetical protein